MSENLQWPEVATSSAGPRTASRRKLAVLIAIAIAALLIIGGGITFAIASSNNAAAQTEAVAAFTATATSTDAAFDDLVTQIDSGSDLVEATDADSVDADAASALDAAVAAGQDFIAEHSGDIEAARTAFNESIGQVALKAALDDLDEAAKTAKTDLKQAKAVSKSSKGKVTKDKVRTPLSNEIEAAQEKKGREAQEAAAAEAERKRQAAEPPASPSASSGSDTTPAKPSAPKPEARSRTDTKPSGRSGCVRNHWADVEPDQQHAAGRRSVETLG